MRFSDFFFNVLSPTKLQDFLNNVRVIYIAKKTRTAVRVHAGTVVGTIQVSVALAFVFDVMRKEGATQGGFTVHSSNLCALPSPFVIAAKHSLTFTYHSAQYNLALNETLKNIKTVLCYTVLCYFSS